MMVAMTVAWMAEMLGASMEDAKAAKKELHSGSSWESLWVARKVADLVDSTADAMVAWMVDVLVLILVVLMATCKVDDLVDSRV